MKTKNQPNTPTPKREPLSRVWFMARGYKKADPAYTNGRTIWLHPKTNDVLNQYGQKIKLQVVPYEKYGAKHRRYLLLSVSKFKNIFLARLKYLTFVGPIPEGYTIDHIDGNTFNNAITNLRAVSKAINSRDGGFMRKLRNNGYNVALFPGIILAGYDRMAKWKATHTVRQYRNLRGDELLQVFLGPLYVVNSSAYDIDRERNRHADLFCERD